jgi:hypothetical protein
LESTQNTSTGNGIQLALGKPQTTSSMHSKRSARGLNALMQVGVKKPANFNTVSNAPLGIGKTIQSHIPMRSRGSTGTKIYSTNAHILSAAVQNHGGS